MKSDAIFKKLRTLKPRFPEMKVRRMAVFGSYARNEANEESDLDILIDPVRPFGLYDMAGLQTEISEYMGMAVDITTFDAAARNKYARHVLEEAEDV
jgi:predicted nucleotidyltransferase